MEKYTYLLSGHGYKILDEYDQEMGAEELCDELETLEITNAALLEALKYLVEQYPNNRGMNKAREAIRKGD